MRHNNVTVFQGRRIAQAVLSILIVFSTSILNAQTFHRLYKVAGGSLEQLAFCTTEDGGAVTAFHRTGGSAVTLGAIKVDHAGNQVWARGFALSSNTTFPVSMAASPDSGVIMALLDPLQMDRIRLMKLDRNGDSKWNITFHAVYWNMDAFPISVLSDGSVLFSHSDNDSLCLKKITPAGALAWARSYRKAGSGIITPSGILNHDSGIYIGGLDAASYASFLLKTDSLGTITWQKEHAGAISSKLNMLPVKSGGLIISTVFWGATTGESRVALFRPDGTVKWTIRIPFLQPQMTDAGPGTVALSVLEQNRVKTVIIDTTGLIKAARSSYDSNADYEYRISSYKGRGFWISGIKGTNLWMMRSDSMGNTGCFTQAETVIPQADSIQPTTMNLLTSLSASLLSNSVFPPQPLGVGDSILCTTLFVPAVGEYTYSCAPNPVLDELVIRRPAQAIPGHFRIISLEGRLITTGELLKAETVLSTADWASGLYFLTIEDAGRKSSTLKVLKR
jgi:hypothetical protein